MHRARSTRSLVLPVVAWLAVLALLAACDAERDLRAYFGSPLPSAGAGGPTAPPSSPSASAAPSVAPSGSPSPTASPTAAPTAAASPSASPTAPASPRPTGSPSPTRPPGLADFTVLRERAAVVPLERLTAQPQAYDDQLLFFEGRVLSVDSDRGGSYRARVRSGGGTIHLVYQAATYWGQPLVPQDRVRLVGYVRGVSDAATHGERVPVIEVYDLVVRFT